MPDEDPWGGPFGPMPKGKTVRSVVALITCAVTVCAAAHADVVTITSGELQTHWEYGYFGVGGAINRPAVQNLSATDSVVGSTDPSMQFATSTYLFSHTALESNYNAQVSHAAFGTEFVAETFMDFNISTAQTVNYEFTGGYTHSGSGGGMLFAQLRDSSNAQVYFEEDFVGNSSATLDDSGFIVVGSRTGVLNPGSYRVILWTRTETYTYDLLAGYANGYVNARFWVEPASLIPLPSASALAGLGLLGLGVRRRRTQDALSN